jgi:hypothetical protein
MNNNEFVFEIQYPQQLPDEDCKVMRLTIRAQYPIFIYPLKLKSVEIMPREDQIQLAIDELKIELIKQIVEAKFELVKA